MAFWKRRENVVHRESAAVAFSCRHQKRTKNVITYEKLICDISLKLFMQYDFNLKSQEWSRIKAIDYLLKEHVEFSIVVTLTSQSVTGEKIPQKLTIIIRLVIRAFKLKSFRVTKIAVGQKTFTQLAQWISNVLIPKPRTQM